MKENKDTAGFPPLWFLVMEKREFASVLNEENWLTRICADSMSFYHTYNKNEEESLPIKIDMGDGVESRMFKSKFKVVYWWNKWLTEYKFDFECGNAAYANSTMRTEVLLRSESFCSFCFLFIFFCLFSLSFIIYC